MDLLNFSSNVMLSGILFSEVRVRFVKKKLFYCSFNYENHLLKAISLSGWHSYFVLLFLQEIFVLLSILGFMFNIFYMVLRSDHEHCLYPFIIWRCKNEMDYCSTHLLLLQLKQLYYCVFTVVLQLLQVMLLSHFFFM